MRTPSDRVRAILVIASLGPLAGPALAGESWPGSEVLQAIRQTQERVVAGCSFTVASSTKTLAGITQTGVSRYRLAPSRYLCESGRGEGRLQWESAVGYTDQYGYRLAQKPPRPAWNVTALELSRPAAMLQRGRPEVLKTLNEVQIKLQAVQFLDVEGVPLDSLLTHASFVVSGMRTEGQRVQVRFTSDVPSTIGPDRITGGEVYLLPPSYVVDEYQITIKPPTPAECRVRMKMEWATAEPPTPAQHAVTYADAKPIQVTLVKKFTDWVYAAQEPAAFAVTQFGLPEPAPVPVASGRLYYFLGAAALLLCGVVGYLRLRK